MSDLETAHLRELVERDYQTYVETYADTPGVQVVGLPEMRLRAGTAWRHEYLNAVFGTQLDAVAVDDRIDEVIARLGADGRAFFWTVWPSDTPADLAARLLAAGFEDMGTDPLMALPLVPVPPAPPHPDGLVIREALTVDEMRRVADFAVRSVGPESDGDDAFAATFIRLATEPVPRWRLFGGEVDGTIVASSAVFSGTGLAGIYSVATAEAHRGRGYGAAMTWAAVEAGRLRGAPTAVLMASELGAPVYRRLGFREVGRVRFLRWPGSGAR